jgi:hypothetical protein
VSTPETPLDLLVKARAVRDAAFHGADWAAAQQESKQVPRACIFFAMTLNECAFSIREEADTSASLQLLAAIEAVFRIDYRSRVENRRPKDDITSSFRCFARAHGDRVRFDHILDTWKEFSTFAKQVTSEIRHAFHHRHWLAHGRHWQSKAAPHPALAAIEASFARVCDLPLECDGLKDIHAVLHS